MKIIVCFLFFTVSSIAQPLAKVQKVNGIEVYILSEPKRPYEVVMGKNNSLQWGSFLTGGIINESISTKVSKFVNGVQKKAESDSITFDAVIYTNGKNVTAIRFLEKSTYENERMAEVQKIDGIPVYVMSEPIVNYKAVSDKGAGIKWKSMLTAGIINNSIEQDINKYVNRMENDFRKNKIQAVLYSTGKKIIGIKFD